MNVIQNRQSVIANGLFQGNREQVRNFLKGKPRCWHLVLACFESLII
jgi:hypothetical protein